MQLWYSVLSCFAAVVAIIGNGIVIFFIIAKHRLHTTANWFILSLAVADFGIGVLSLPRYFVCDIENTCSNKNAESVVSLMVFLGYASTLNLWAMTFDRYVAIVKPLQYMALMTTRRVISILATAWIVALLLTITRILISVVMVPGHNQSTALNIVMGVLVTLCFFCGCFLVVATGHIIFITWKHSQQIATIVAQLNFNQPESAPVITVNTATQESSAAKLTTAVVVVNLSCLLINLAAIWCSKIHVRPCTLSAMPLRVAATLLLTVNSAVNPVMYALLKRDIRNELKRMFTSSVNVSE